MSFIRFCAGTLKLSRSVGLDSRRKPDRVRRQGSRLVGSLWVSLCKRRLLFYKCADRVKSLVNSFQFLIILKFLSKQIFFFLLIRCEHLNFVCFMNPLIVLLRWLTFISANELYLLSSLKGFNCSRSLSFDDHFLLSVVQYPTFFFL